MLKKGTILKIREFYINNPEYADDIFRAIKEFFGECGWFKYIDIAFGLYEEGFFNEWLTYDFKFSDGKGMLEKYYFENPNNIPEYRRVIYKNLMENYFGLFEVLDVEPFVKLKLRRIDDLKEFEVREMSATMQAVGGDIFFGRVANVGDVYELVGSDSVIFKFSALSDYERSENIKFYSKYKKITLIDALKILKDLPR